MNCRIEAKIELAVRYYRNKKLSTAELADKYYTYNNIYVEAVMEGGDTEEFYVKKEAARRLLVEKGVGYER